MACYMPISLGIIFDVKTLSCGERRTVQMVTSVTLAVQNYGSGLVRARRTCPRYVLDLRGCARVAVLDPTYLAKPRLLWPEYP